MQSPKQKYCFGSAFVYVINVTPSLGRGVANHGQLSSPQSAVLRLNPFLSTNFMLCEYYANACHADFGEAAEPTIYSLEYNRLLSASNRLQKA